MFSVLSCFDFKVKYLELETYSNVTTREGKSYDIFCCFITFILKLINNSLRKYKGN